MRPTRAVSPASYAAGHPARPGRFYDLSNTAWPASCIASSTATRSVSQMCRVHDLQADSLDLLQLHYLLFENTCASSPNTACSSASSTSSPRPTTKACEETPPIPFQFILSATQAVCVITVEMAPHESSPDLADDWPGRSTPTRTTPDLVDAALSVGHGSLIRAILALGQGQTGGFCAASTFCPTVTRALPVLVRRPVGTRGTDRTDPTPAGQAVNRRISTLTGDRNRARLCAYHGAQLQPCFRELGRPQRATAGRETQVAPTTRQERWSASPHLRRAPVAGVSSTQCLKPWWPPGSCSTRSRPMPR